ncbi:tripartite tricarboxylate transporter permease [Ammoniphilus resinae]|uniref:Tricarboxylic transport membrane protein n=1 Tax=Ammoniphilus resinae TaxID=861532 RepID=A0ABS4GKS8_9BACL|nr:tripartite tricarboxylate transporter permease [Ammoniphilus resinae]MBP1930846.1 putative tricarboxylic transport membrane protein [Ammoniphilus resinae]
MIEGIMSGLLDGFVHLMNPSTILFILIGVTVGTLIGALPGVGASAATAILLPVAFSIGSAGDGLVMLAGIFYGSMYGGTITSVLLRTPGETASIMTSIEGYPLYQQGKGGLALSLAAIGSFVAGTVGVVALTIFAPTLAKMAAVLGPVEMFSLILLSMSLVSGLGGSSIPKSLIMIALGLLISTIGQDPIEGVMRLTFDSRLLIAGIEFLPVIIGFFAIANLVTELDQLSDTMDFPTKIGSIVPKAKDLKDAAMPTTRGTIIGFFCGILPGVGATISSFLAYATEKRFSKHPEKFGNGAMDGLVGAESANNSSTAGSMVPLMSLGIPGSTTTAVLMAGFLMYGLQPGPLLFERHPEVAWTLIASMFLGNVMLLVLNTVTIPFFVWVVNRCQPFIAPIVVTLSVAGVYTLQNSMVDVWLMLVFAIVGYVLEIQNYPLVPLILGIVLGSIGEMSFRQGLIMSQGDFTIFLTHPISAFFLATAVIMVFAPRVYKKMRKRTIT